MIACYVSICFCFSPVILYIALVYCLEFTVYFNAKFIMEIFEFCLEIVKREAEKFNVGINHLTPNEITAATANDINYDVVHNRCAYVYRCGAINIALVADCFSSFMMKYEGLFSLFSKWRDCSNLTMSSITKGPALDYVAFLLSSQHNVFFQKINVISKHGAWRNTVNIMHEIVTEGYFKPLTNINLGNIEVIQGDPFQNFSEKVKEPLCNSDVVVMIKSVKFADDLNDQGKFSNALMEMFAALKPGAVLFCIDTKPVTALIHQALLTFPGCFLFEPILVNTMLSFDCPDSYKLIFGCPPVISARGIFFVWQKSDKVPSNSYNEVAGNIKSLCLNSSDKSNENDNDSIYSKKLSSSEFNSETDLKCITGTDCAVNPLYPEYTQPNTLESDDLKNTNHDLIKNTKTSTPVTTRLPLEIDVHTNDSSKKEDLKIVNTEKNTHFSRSESLQNLAKISLNKKNSVETVYASNVSLSPAHLDTKYKSSNLTDSSNSTTQTSSPVPLIKKIASYDLMREETYETFNAEKNNPTCMFNELSESQVKVNSEETHADKIVTLTNRISKLTETMKDLLQKNAHKHTSCIESKNPYFMPNDYNENQCSSAALQFPNHSYPHCVSQSSCVCVGCRRKYVENCCQKHVCCQNFTHVNHNYCPLHDSGCETFRNCSSLQGNVSNCANGKNDSVDEPKLVIPLNNLSKDVLSQIILSLSKQ